MCTVMAGTDCCIVHAIEPNIPAKTFKATIAM